MTISPVYPIILQNGTIADANQVMADFYQIQNDVNTNAAHNGANSDITSLNGLTTPLPISEGGTGASTAAQALINLGVTAALAAIVTPPVGAILLWTSDIVPTNFFECNGQAINRINYSALFTLFGTTYGAGDGSTTFNIPDLRGYFVRGWANTSSEDSGRAFGSIQTNQLQTHTHATTDPGHVHPPLSPGTTIMEGGLASGNWLGGPNGGTSPTTGSAVTGITVNAPNSGHIGAETRPDNVALMYIMRAL